MRHSEGRYEVPKPNEYSAAFEQMLKLDEGSVEEVSRSIECGEQEFVLIAAYDGIGGARRAMEILGVEPTLYVSIECDLKCQEVVKRAWPDVISFGLIEETQELRISEVLDRLDEALA